MGYRMKGQVDPNKIFAIRRGELSMTQSEVARKLGYANTNFVSMLENGQSKVPLEKAQEIARVLEMDEKWYVEKVFRARHPDVAELLLGKISSEAAA